MDQIDPSQVVVSFGSMSHTLDKEAVAKVASEELAAIPFEDRVRMQAGLENGLAALEDDQREPGVMVAPNLAPAALWLAFIAEKAQEEGKLEPTKVGTYEAKFDSRDWAGWAGSFFSWWRGLRKHEWISAQPDPDPMPANARIAMLADWGTGLYGAPVCAKSILASNPAPHVVLHLGDVYYAGLEREVKARFLKLFPHVPGATLRATNSNHEMYSGGGGYFGHTLPALGQTSSYFALENDRWLLVGLDTGYAEHDLFGDQVEWLEKLLARAKQKEQRVIVVCHHQPFSVFEGQGKKLVAKLQPWLDEKRIFAWYWGHEHRCTLHDKHPSWQLYGACIGHGGFPYFRDNVEGVEVVKANTDGTKWHRVKGPSGVPGALLLDGPNLYLGEHARRYGPNGYMTLQLGEKTLHETVHAADGTVLHERELS